MRVVLQRVNFSNVTVNDKEVGKINKGLLVFLGIKEDDDEKDLSYIIDKIVNLRIFEDHQGKMNLSLKDINGALQVVSQFTLYGDCKKGRRPSFTRAAKPEKAMELYNKFIEETNKLGFDTKTGQFQAHMCVNLQNDGPVTMLIDSEKIF